MADGLIHPSKNCDCKIHEERSAYLLMEIQQQNENQLAPWNHDEELPRNIIIEFQTTKKETNKTQSFSRKSSFNLQRFLQRRRHKASLKLANRMDQRSLSPQGEQRVQITTLSPQNVMMNETLRLKEMFPSYNLKRDLKESTFYKPQRYHSIHSTHEDYKLIPFRRSIQNRKPDLNNLARKLTNNKIVHQLHQSPPLSNSKRLQDNQSEFLRRTVTQSQPTTIKLQVEKTKFAINFKPSINKQQRLQQIVSMIEKKEKALYTSQHGSQLQRCLKSKKELFLNLPKIQFTELSQ